MEPYIKTYDTYENSDALLCRQRGKRGIAILWKKELSSHIEKIDISSDRIQMITLNKQYAIINCYMPCVKDATNLEEYKRCLDLLHFCIETSIKSGYLPILVGDMNGSVIRNANRHDTCLQEFVRSHNLQTKVEGNTFYGHNGCSQIDYIFTTSDAVDSLDSVVFEQDELNVSSHIPVSTKLPFQQRTIISNNKHPSVVLRWKNANYSAIANDCIELLPDSILDLNNNNNDAGVNVDAISNTLIKTISQAVERNVPKCKQSFKGRMKPLPKHVLDKLKASREAVQNWKDNGKPIPGSTLYMAKNKAKVDVRRALRQNKARKRQSFYESIMENANNSNFHKLINLQRKSTIAMHGFSINGVYDEVSQLEILTGHYKQLATPDDFIANEYHDLVSDDVQKIRKIIADTEYDPLD